MSLPLLLPLPLPELEPPDPVDDEPSVALPASDSPSDTVRKELQ